MTQNTSINNIYMFTSIDVSVCLYFNNLKKIKHFHFFIKLILCLVDLKTKLQNQVKKIIRKRKQTMEMYQANGSGGRGIGGQSFNAVSLVMGAITDGVNVFHVRGG